MQTVRLECNDEGRQSLRCRLVSTARYTEQYSVLSGVLVDQQGRVLAADEVRLTYRVEKPDHAADVMLRFGSLSPDAAPARLLVGFNSEVVGGHVGSAWGRYFRHDPIFPVARLLSTPNPDVQLVGLTEFRDSQRSQIQYHSRPRSAARCKHLAEALAPLRPQLVELFESADDPEILALACRLAGYSTDATYGKRLIRLLDHEDPLVRDSAAIGLGLLKDRRGLPRVQHWAAASPESRCATNADAALANDAKNAMDILSGLAPED